MHSKRKAIASEHAYGENKRKKTQQEAHNANDFLQFPQEIRDTIYRFVFDRPIRPVDSLDASFNKLSLLDTGLLRVNKRLYDEAVKFIMENVQVRISVSNGWSDREKQLLRTCQHLVLTYHEQINFEAPVWNDDLRSAVATRQDIKTFHFKGVGGCILGHLALDAEYLSRTFHELISMLAFGRAMDVLRSLPEITAKRWIKVSWSGDNKLPRDNEHVQEYRELVSRIEAGRGGNDGTAFSMFANPFFVAMLNMGSKYEVGVR